MRPRNFGLAIAIGAAGVAVAVAAIPSSASGGPSGWLTIDGKARNAVTATPLPYDWANHGTAYDNTSCSNGGINATDTAGTLGTGGIFNCGKQATPTASNPNPVPIAPTLTTAAAADPSIIASAFIVDPLFNSNNKNTGLTCPVTGVPTTSGDPSVLTTGASKNDLPLSGFVYLPGSLQPKDDLGNVYAVAHRTTGVNEVYFGAERVVNNGASHVDFEFLQSQVGLVPSGTTGAAACTGNLSGHRTGGDFLAAVDFANGGALGSDTIYEWSCGGTTTSITEGTVCDPGTTQFPNAQYVNVTALPQGAAFNIAVNGNGPIPCGGWVCRGQAKGDTVNQMATNEFMEGGVNLATLGFTGCVSTFLPHTRSSPDINSTLQDFAGPVTFNTCSIKTAPAKAVTDIRSGGLTDAATVDGFIGAPGTVDFKLYGPFASGAAITSTSCVSPVFDSGPVSSSQSSAPATFKATSGAPPGVGVYQWVATYSGGVAGVCGDPTEQALVVDANIQITPPTKTNAVGTNHVLTGHVSVSSGTSYVNAPIGTTITFAVTNSNGANTTTSGSCTTTDASGSCTFTITSSTAGQDSINASTSVLVGGLTLTRTTDGLLGDSGAAAKTWVDAKINLSPLTAANEIGKNHKITATVLVNGGNGAGFVAANDGTLVTFTLGNSNGASATFAGGNTCLTSSGMCSVFINSPTAGTVTINATTNVSVGGLTLTRTTGDSNAGDGGPAQKTYVNANLSISPATAANEINHNHVIFALVKTDTGNGAGLQPTAGVTVNFTLANSNAATAGFVGPSSCTTGAAGTCNVTIVSPTSGQTAISATFTTMVDGVSITRSTGDGLSGDSGNAAKTWVDANLSISPATAANEINHNHVIFALVKTDTGNGAGLQPTAGVTVNFTLANSNAATAGFVGPSSCTTGAAGTCSVTIVSPTSGQTAISATFTTMVDGVSITRSTGDGLSGDSGNAAKTWVDANINLALEHTPDLVGSVEKVTATVMTNDGTGFKPANGAVVTLSIVGSSVGNFVPSGSTATCTTDATGTCFVQITSNVIGTTTVHATTTVNVLGVPLTRATSDGHAGDGADIVKTWIPYNPTLATTQSADGAIGITKISDTATVSGAFGAAGASDLVTFKLYGPFSSAAAVNCTGTAVFSEGPDQLAGGTPGLPGQVWTVSTSGSFTPTDAGYYAWVVTANFTGDQANTTPAASNCTEIVHITPVNPTLATQSSSPAGFQINTTGTITDTATLSGFVNLKSSDTVTFNLYGPFGSGTPVCDTTNNTNRVLGPIAGGVNTTTGVATTGNQSFSPTIAGTYYWVASFSGDVNNTTLNATNVGCGDSHEAVVVLAPTAQITPTNTTCQQFASGTASTLANFFYSGSGSIGQGVNPGVFFYYEKVTIGAGATITVNQTLTSGQTNGNYVLQVLNNDPSQVQVFDSNCNSIGGAKITIAANGTVTISGLPAGSYIFSVKYSPKSIAGQPIPSPSATLIYSFSTSVGGNTVSGSTQGITGIRQ